MAVGLDVGTMNLISAYYESDNLIFKAVRNAFIKIDDSEIGAVDLSKIAHAYIEDDLYILGTDAFNFANIFGKTINRPMSKGLISPSEIDAIDVLSVLIKNIIPDNVESNSKCVYSCPANSIDSSNDIIYHREVLKRLISTLGLDPLPINEAVAIVYSNCKETNFTGLAISFGAGMTNVALVYKTVPIFEFSIERGGDWIDQNAANAVGSIPNRVCSIKEKSDFDILNWNVGKKRERRIREAISHYYRELISYTCHSISKKLMDADDTQLPDSIPIIISGGTSTISSFVELFQSIIDDYIDDYPFDITEIKKANDQLNAVAHGCLIRALL